MSHSRTAVILAALLILLPAALPVVTALPAASGDLPSQTVDVVEPAFNATCDAGFRGTCAAVNETDGTPSAGALAAGACSDALAMGVNCTQSPPPTTTAPKVVSMNITQPAAATGARPGTEVTIVWTSNVIDPLNRGVAFSAQVRSLSGAGQWTALPGYQCTASPSSNTGTDGTCQTKWTPAATGAYAIRVLFAPGPLAESICTLGQNCAMVAPFFVDATAPGVETPCVMLGGSCAPSGLGLSTTALAVTAGASDETALANVVITAVGPKGSTSCALPSSHVRGQSSIGKGNATCSLDVSGILHPTALDVYAGDITVTATAYDTAGNPATSGAVSHRIDTAPNNVVQTQLIPPEPPVLVQNNQNINLDYKVVYTSPSSRAGQPAGGLAFTVETASGTACSGTTSPLGRFNCTVAHADKAVTFTAAAVPTADVASVSTTSTITWTSIVVERVRAEDTPRNTTYANVEEAYSPAFRLRFSHNQTPAGHVFSSLAAPGFTTSVDWSDGTGLVLVPQVSTPSAVANFQAAFRIGEVTAASTTGNITWTAIVVSNVTFDRPLANAGDTVRLTAKAVYENNPGRAVEGGRLAIPTLPADCVLGTASVRSGTLTVAVTCGNVHNHTSFPVIIEEASADGITVIRQSLAFVANWTSITLSNPSYRTTFTNVSDPVHYRATATYAHNGSLVPNATLAGLSLPSSCTGNGAILAGALEIVASCTTAGDRTLSFVVNSGHANVTLLRDSTASVRATWTRVVFSDLVVNDSMVNVGSPVTVTGTLTYEHDGSNVQSATLGLVGLGAAHNCAVLAGDVVDGAVNASVACGKVANFSQANLNVTVSGTTGNVTLAVAPGVIHAVWTEIEFSDVATNKTFVNVTDTIRITGTATYAHDGTPVPSARLAAPTLPTGCALGERDVAAGALAVTVSCSTVTDMTAGTALVVASEANGITRSDAPSINATWTRIRITTTNVSDTLVNAGDVVFLNGTAVYEHDNSTVFAGTLQIDPAAAPAGCTLVTGTIANGTMRSAVRCTQVANLSAAGVPLTIRTTDTDVVALAQNLSVKSIWTRIDVSYTKDTTASTLDANRSAHLDVRLSYAHDGTPVVNGNVRVASGAPGDSSVYTCTTAGDVLPGVAGACRVTISKGLGRFTFNVTGASTNKAAGFAPDVVAMNNTPAPVTYRWTAIAFNAFQCSVGGAAATPCAGRTFAPGTAVNVTATAIAADTGEILVGANVRLNGYALTTDSAGAASFTTTSLSSGQLSVQAYGESASFNGDAVTATFERTETLTFT